MASTTPIRIRVATKEDIPTMVDILHRAFAPNKVQTILFPEHLKTIPGSGDYLAFRTSRFERDFLKMKPHMYYIVAVQDTPSGDEVMVGCAEWMAPVDEADSEPAKKKTWKERAAALPAGMDPEAYRAHFECTKKLEAAVDEFVGEGSTKRMWWANSIAVDPDHQGKGIGTVLARWGIEQADKDGKDVFLIASSAGALLYRKLGFTDICSEEALGQRSHAMVKRRGE
ncbi:acetyltransferase [Seiridium cupressi]